MSSVLPTPFDRCLQFRRQDPGATDAHTALLFFATHLSLNFSLCCALSGAQHYSTLRSFDINDPTSTNQIRSLLGSYYYLPATMEFPALPSGTSVQSYANWSGASPADQAALYLHWDHDSNSALWIHVAHPGLAPWVIPLGGRASPHDPETLALDLHVLDTIFARCFVINDPNVASRVHGHWMIAPSRYGEVLTALVTSGLDLSLPSKLDPRFVLTELVERIESMLPRLETPFELRVDDMIPTVDEISVDDRDLWQSKIPLGSLRAHSVGGAPCYLEPLADLRAMQGFYLHASDREYFGDRFRVTIEAIKDHMTVGVRQHLAIEHWPKLVADFLRRSKWERELRIMTVEWPDLLDDLEQRITIATSDKAAVQQAVMSRFPAVLRALPPLDAYVGGVNPTQAYSHAVSLAEQVLSVAANLGTLPSFRTLSAFLSNKVAILTPALRASDPSARIAAVVAAHESDARPAVASSAAISAEHSISSDGSAQRSSSAVGICFTDAYRSKLNDFRHSQTVLGPLVYFPASYDRAGSPLPPAVEELKSGLLALISQPKIRDYPEEKLRLLYLRGNQFVNQFLAADNHHSDEFFQLLAGLRLQLNKSLAKAVVADSSGRITHEHDKTFQFSESFMKSWNAGRLTDINFYNEVLVKIAAHRSSSTAPPPVAFGDQWFQHRSSELALMVEKMIAFIGYPRMDSELGFLSFYNEVTTYVNSAPAPLSFKEQGKLILLECFKQPEVRWRQMLTSPPPTAVPDSFLLPTDTCFTMLREAKRSQQAMLDTDNAVPGYIAGIAKTASIGLSQDPPHARGGGDTQDGGRGRGKGKRKGRARGNDGSGKGGGKGGGRQAANQPPPKKEKFDPAKQFPPGSMAGHCSWAGRKLTIKREKFDSVTGTSTPMAPMTVDAGAYCDATNTPIADVCFPFVATVVSMNHELGTPGRTPSYFSLALAAARCPHWGSGTHTAACAGLHALPSGSKLKTMKQYFH